MRRKRIEKPWTPRQPVIVEGDCAAFPYGHCPGCFGIQDDGTTHYEGTVEHPFTEQQATNYRLGRKIDAIATEVE